MSQSEAADSVSAFLSERVEWVDGARTPISALYEAYALFCREKGLKREGRTQVGKRLNELEIPTAKSGGTRYRVGLRLCPISPPPVSQSSPTSQPGGNDLEGAPADLQPETARWFVDLMADYGLEPHHECLLLSAARAWDRASFARAELEIHQALTRTLTYINSVGNIVAHPAVKIIADSERLYAAQLRELGLDEAAPGDNGAGADEAEVI